MKYTRNSLIVDSLFVFAAFAMAAGLAFAVSYFAFPVSTADAQAGTLTCAPAEQTVSVGQSASFAASGVATTTFSWGTANTSVPNGSSTLTASFTEPGTQVVVVQAAGQSATCVVHVVGTGGPATGTPGFPDTGGGGGMLAPLLFGLALIAGGAGAGFAYLRARSS